MKFSFTLNKAIFKAAILFCALLSFDSAQAAIVTWNGDSGDWHKAAYWDTGQIPNANDVVIIPHGEVFITQGNAAVAKRVEIGTNSILVVEKYASLTASGAEFGAGILNEGEFYISGDVEINMVTLHANSYVDANGLENRGHCEVKMFGELSIYEIHYRSISNPEGATFKNYGDIHIEKVGTSGIRNEGDFRNYSSIELVVPQLGYSHTYGLQNLGVFINYSNGEIDIQAGTNGFLNWLNGLFYNYGIINTKNIEKIALRNENLFFNQYNGRIALGDGEQGVVNKDRFYNKGELIIKYMSFYGVKNEDRFYNTKKLDIQDCYRGIVSDDFLSNKGQLDIKDCTQEAITINDGSFNNYEEAQVVVNNRIALASNSEFNNVGFVVNTFNGVNAMLTAGAIVFNDGVINHPFATTNTSQNDELFIGSITGTLQNGVAYANALDLVNWDQVEFLGVYSDLQKTKEVAEYDAKNNILTPGDEAIGLSWLWFELALDGGDNRKMCRLTLASPVLPFVINNQQTTYQTSKSDNSTITVFPNPSRGALTIQSDLFSKLDSKIIVLNTVGQIVLSKKVSQYDKGYLTLSDQLNNGMYFLKIYQNDQLVGEERFQLIR